MKSIVKIISFGVALAWVNSSVAATGMESSAVPVAGTADSAPTFPPLKMTRAVRPEKSEPVQGAAMSRSAPVATESVTDTLPIEWDDDRMPVEEAGGATGSPEPAVSRSAQLGASIGRQP